MSYTYTPPKPSTTDAAAFTVTTLATGGGNGGGNKRSVEDDSAHLTPSKKSNDLLSGGGALRDICNPQLKQLHLQQQATNESKGLRYFSGKVAKKVEEKGHTTYQEVADELVNETLCEMQNGLQGDNSKKIEHKNIRRRIYDALNVLMAMDVIGKDKKDIHWQGLPEFLPEFPQHAESSTHFKENKTRVDEINSKRKALFELLRQQVIYRNLVKSNREREKARSANSPNIDTSHFEKVSLPLCLVAVPPDSKVSIEIGPDERNASLSFSDPFQILDDKELLAKKGFDKATEEELRLMMPKDLYQYCEEHNLLKSLVKN